MAHWGAAAATASHSVSITGRFVRTTGSEGGPDTSGGNGVPAQCLLRSDRLQQHVRDICRRGIGCHTARRAAQAALNPISEDSRQ